MSTLNQLKSPVDDKAAINLAEESGYVQRGGCSLFGSEFSIANIFFQQNIQQRHASRGEAIVVFSDLDRSNLPLQPAAKRPNQVRQTNTFLLK